MDEKLERKSDLLNRNVCKHRDCYENCKYLKSKKKISVLLI